MLGAAVDTLTHKGVVHLQLVWGIKGHLETSLPEGPRSRVAGNTGDGEEIVKELLCRHWPNDRIYKLVSNGSQ